MIAIQTEIAQVTEFVAEGVDMYLDTDQFCLGLFSVEEQAYMISPEANIAQIMVALTLFEHSDMFPVIYHPSKQQFRNACRYIL